MTTNTITVYYNNMPMMIDSDVAIYLNLKDDYIVKSEQEFWKILNTNCNAMISIIEAQLLIENRS